MKIQYINIYGGLVENIFREIYTLNVLENKKDLKSVTQAFVLRN